MAFMAIAKTHWFTDWRQGNHAPRKKKKGARRFGCLQVLFLLLSGRRAFLLRRRDPEITAVYVGRSTYAARRGLFCDNPSLNRGTAGGLGYAWSFLLLSFLSSPQFTWMVRKKPDSYPSPVFAKIIRQGKRKKVSRAGKNWNRLPK